MNRKYALKPASDQLKNTIVQGLRLIQQFRYDYIFQKGAIELAETQVEGAQLNLQAGEATPCDLQNAQDSLIYVQNRRTAALMD